MLLEVSHLSVAYRGVEALRDVSLSVAEGELVTVIGANGAGKTTLLKAIMGWEPAAGGSISFDGRDLGRLKTHARARQGLRIVPERARVFPQLSVYENLMMGVYGLRGLIPLQDRLRRLYQLFPILEERGGQWASTLSGG